MISNEKQLNLVIADDDADDHYFLKKAIKDINPNHRITSVYNGSQLVDYLLRLGIYIDCSEPLPDCILLDLNMPIMNGFEALNRIKSFEELKKIPVFMLSSSINPEDKKKALELGAKEYYCKTHDPEMLRIILQTIFSKLG